MVILRVTLLLLVTGLVIMAQPSAGAAADMDPELRKYILSRIGEFDDIPEERRRDLRELSHYVKDRIDAGVPARLNFICTHNSRRSQMCQIWAKAAAEYYRVDGVEAFSGGTESTALNSRAVAALQRSGVQVQKLDETGNPRYAIRFHSIGDPLICYSKKYDRPPNPEADFAAVMTCSDADRNCPLVQSSPIRVVLPYEDPRIADNTRQEQSTYDERCRQICREMFYLFSQL